MKTGRKKEHQNLLEAFFRRADPGLVETLEGVTLFRITQGRFLNLDLFQPEDQICLLKGRIEVLMDGSASGSGMKQSLTEFIPGQVLSFSTIRQFGLLLAAITDEAIICPVPESCIFEHKILRESRDALLAHIMTSLPRTDAPSEDPEFRQMMEGPIQASVKQCLKQLMSYCPPLKEVVAPGEVPENFAALNTMIAEAGFQIHEEHVSWNQLLDREPHAFPIVLEDPDRFCHWIVGVKGRSLHELWFGRSTPFSPRQGDSQHMFSILWLVPPKEELSVIASSAKDLFSLNWYVRILTHEWLLTSQMFLASVMVQILSLGIPIFSMVIFDRVFGRQNFSTLNVMTVGIAIVALADIAIKSARSFILSHQLTGMDRITARALLKKLMDAPIGLDRRKETQKDEKSGDKNAPKGQLRKNQLRIIPERFADLFKTNQTIVSMFLMNGPDAIFSVILMVVLIILSPTLAIVSLFPLLPIGIEALVTGPKRKKAAAQSSKEHRDIQLLLTEYLIQAETLQAVYAEEFWKKNVFQKIQTTLKNGFQTRFERIGSGNLQGFFGNVGSVATLFIGAHEVLEGKITFGVYLAVNMLGRQVISSAQKFLSAAGEFQEAMDNVKTFQDLFAADEGFRTKNQQTFYLEQAAGDIRVVNVHFRYEGNLPWVLKGMSLHIPAGQKIVLVGPSGSGKTTILRLLQRIFTPNQRYLCLDGINTVDMDLESLRQCIGVVSQKPTLFSGTIYDNLVMGNPLANMSDILDTLQLVGMEEEIMHNPKGLEAEVYPMGANFSGGQSARLALARVLLKKPSVLILDESLSQVEPALQAQIYDRIWTQYKNATCIFVTDYMPIHQRADGILVIQDGQLVEVGTYNELMKANGLYCKLFQPDVTNFSLNI